VANNILNKELTPLASKVDKGGAGVAFPEASVCVPIQLGRCSNHQIGNSWFIWKGKRESFTLRICLVCPTNAPPPNKQQAIEER